MVAWRKLTLAAVLMAIPMFSGLSGCSSTGDKVLEVPSYSSLPDLRIAGLQQKWQRHLKLRGGEHVTDAWRMNKSVYVVTDQTRVFRMESDSGVLAFSEELSTQRIPIYRPSEFRLDPNQPNREVFVATRSQAFVLDKRNGDVLRSSDLPLSASCPPVVANGSLVVAGSNGPQAALRGLFVDSNLGGQRWSYNTEQTDLFLSTPVVIEGTVAFATKSGRVMRIAANNGDWIWKDRKTNGQVIAGLAADGRAVYVPSLDKKVYAFHVDDGHELWQQTLDGVLDKAPALAGTVLMVPSTGRGLYAVTRKDGAHRWFVPDVTNVLTTTGDNVWVGDNAGNLKSIRFETGEVEANVHVDDVQIFVRNPVDDQVLLVAHSGAVAAYMPLGKGE